MVSRTCYPRKGLKGSRVDTGMRPGHFHCHDLLGHPLEAHSGAIPCFRTLLRLRSGLFAVKSVPMLTTPAPRPRSLTPSRGRSRDLGLVAGVLALLVGLNLLAHTTAAATWFFTVPVGAAVILVLAKLAGLSWRDIGFSRGSVKKGLAYGAVTAGLVAAVVGAALAMPLTREFFLNDTYASIRTALIAALILIPLQTVLPEELAFRGVLHGSLQRLGGTRAVFLVGSLAFGLWHVMSSLGLTASNAGLSSVLGAGSFGQWVGVSLAVAATATAGVGLTWLRHRTGSVVAPIMLHWALNAVGALAAAVAWQLA